MKKIIYIVIAIVVLAFIAILLSGVGGTDTTPASESSEEVLGEESPANSQVPEGEIVNISTQDSEVSWEGRRPLLENYKDTGNLGIKEGYFTVEGEVLLGGKVIFDMNTIEALSTGARAGEDRLAAHLKSPDWFDVESFPTAEFVISEVTEGSVPGEVTLSGTLTVRSITRNISVPANVNWDEDILTVEGEAELDRTLWDIKYGSGKFFQDLADNVIDDLFGVEFKAVAQR